MKCRFIIHGGKGSLDVCLGTKLLHSSSGVSKGVSGECEPMLAAKGVSKGNFLC